MEQHAEVNFPSLAPYFLAHKERTSVSSGGKHEDRFCSAIAFALAG